MMKYSAYAVADSTCLGDNFGERLMPPAEFNRSLAPYLTIISDTRARDYTTEKRPQCSLRSKNEDDSEEKIRETVETKNKIN